MVSPNQLLVPCTFIMTVQYARSTCIFDANHFPSEESMQSIAKSVLFIHGLGYSSVQ